MLEHEQDDDALRKQQERDLGEVSFPQLLTELARRTSCFVLSCEMPPSSIYGNPEGHLMLFHSGSSGCISQRIGLIHYAAVNLSVAQLWNFIPNPVGCRHGENRSPG